MRGWTDGCLLTAYSVSNVLRMGGMERESDSRVKKCKEEEDEGLAVRREREKESILEKDEAGNKDKRHGLERENRFRGSLRL